MKTCNHLAAAALFAIAGVAVAQEPEGPVAVNVEGLPQSLRIRIEEKAKEGPEALIRYLNRTRHLHQLRPEEIIKAREEALSARKDDTRVTARADAPRP
jgi:hypothetical protein